MSSRPRRRKKSAASRLRPFLLLLFFVAAGVGAAAYYGASWPGFRPAAVRVSGNRVVDSREILARAAIAPDRNVWLQNMRAAAARVKTIPYIDGAWIHRTPPAGVSIVVTERQPAAVLQTPAGQVLIDRRLRVLGPVTAGAQALPRIKANAAVPAPGATVHDASVARLLADAQTLLAAHVAVSAVYFDRFGDVDATMRSGIELLLGSDADIAAKSAMVAPILSQAGAGGRKIAAIDLRAPKTPVVRRK